MADQPAKRRRGRPRGGESDARARILNAAVHEFAEHGYDSATTRGIAARAGVDAASLHHHFGTKADLFAAVIDTPIRPDQIVGRVTDGPVDGMGERLVRVVLGAVESADEGPRAVMLLRTAIGSRLTSPLLAGYLQREVIGPLAAHLGLDDALLRASLAASQIGGLIVARHVLKLPALADASVDEIAPRAGAAIQSYLVV
ncbi:MAG: TetR/AcrR family transcriptional regulator [Pseudoclavibacter sp.]